MLLPRLPWLLPLPLPLPLPLLDWPHVLQQYLPSDEQPPAAFTAVQDVSWPCVILDRSVPDTSAQVVLEHVLQQYDLS